MRGAAARTARTTAAPIWGVSQDEYLDKADVWPLNPDGELLLGLKLEDKYALANADENLKVPGIAFAEWGPGDMALSLNVRGRGGGDHGSGDGGGAGQGVRRLQGEQGVLPELDEPRQRGRDDSGRRDGRAGEPAGRRDRPAVHEASDAVVNKSGQAILALAIVFAVAGSGQASRPQAPTLIDLLNRLGTYLDDYTQSLSLLVAEEQYEQQLVIGGRAESKRVLRSDYGMLRLPDAPVWSGFRDTFLVDGQPVRRHEGRLEQLLVDGSDEAVEQARRIAEDNAEYNLGSDLIYRTINVPMLTLDLLSPSNRDRLTFRMRGHEVVNQREVWKIDFVERAPPSLIRTPAGPDQITRGSVWVGAAAGTVVKTYLNVVIGPTSQARITVEYATDAKLGFFVPVTMHESVRAFLVQDCHHRHLYELPAIQHERPPGRRRKVNGLRSSWFAGIAILAKLRDPPGAPALTETDEIVIGCAHDTRRHISVDAVFGDDVLPRDFTLRVAIAFHGGEMYQAIAHARDDR